MSAEWFTELMKDTISIYGKPEINNTDQGSQYTSKVYIDLLKDNQIQISMDVEEEP
jgi:putative transposase